MGGAVRAVADAVAAADMSELVSIDPATGDAVGKVEVTPIEAMPELVARARHAQVGWAALSFAERADMLRTAGERLLEGADALGELGTREMGKPLREMVGEARYVAQGFPQDLDELERALRPEVLERGRTRTTVYRDPFGVAACIAPWNFPVAMPHQQVLPALAAGNAVLLKPSERTPLTGQAYGDALMAALPPDVLQVVHGDGAQGRALVASDLDLVVFTGSRAAGVHILGEASRALKRVILELGGKDPLVVLDDADLERAARFAASNSFRNAGQVCVSTERIYVHQAVHDAFVDQLVEAAKALRVGAGMEPDTRVGPMVDERQKAHVEAQLSAALQDGATVAWRGEKNDGRFLAPVVLTGVTDAMQIATEETFGPVACVFAVGDDAEAVRRANDTPYGLGAVVFGGAERARAVARQLTAGMIGVNQGLSSAGRTPWVGARQSGYGFHSGVEGHRQFAQVRVLSEAL